MDWLMLHPFLVLYEHVSRHAQPFRSSLCRWHSDSFPDCVKSSITCLSTVSMQQLRKEFHKTEIAFLDYHIDPDEVKMVRGKVMAVIEWPEPTTVKELQSFLGFANFYSYFIWGYSTVAAPLTDLLKGNKMWWIRFTPHTAFAKKCFVSA